MASSADAGWNVASDAAPPVGALPGQTVPWDVTQARETGVGDPAAVSDRRSQRGMRETITVWLLVLLCFVVGLSFVALLFDVDVAMADKRYERLKSLLDVLLGPIVTLLSSVTGFYFGSQAAQDRAGTADRKNDGAS